MITLSPALSPLVTTQKRPLVRAVSDTLKSNSLDPALKAEAVLPDHWPLPDTAFYFGWYTTNASGAIASAMLLAPMLINVPSEVSGSCTPMPMNDRKAG